jgi:LDH2 family malate/lactate/ureidoglycolate dehydrogenase
MRIDQQRYRQGLERLLAAGGVDPVQAISLTDNLMWCDKVGRRNHGVERLPVMLKRVATGAIRSPCDPQITRLAPAAERIDADAGFGHHAGKLGMERACALAAEQKKRLEIAAANAALNMDDLPETLMLGRSAALRQDYSAPEQATSLGR